MIRGAAERTKSSREPAWCCIDMNGSLDTVLVGSSGLIIHHRYSVPGRRGREYVQHRFRRATSLLLLVQVSSSTMQALPLDWKT